MNTHKGTIRLSYSTLTTFNSCERKFAMRKVYNIEEERTNTPATNLGSAVGSAYQHWLASGRDYELAYLACWVYFEHGCEDKLRNIFKAIEALDALIDATPDTWEMATMTTPDGNQKPAMEVSFCINCGELPDGVKLTYVGYLDGAIYTGTPYVETLEIKTTAMAGQVRANYSNSSQGVGYSIVCSALARREGLAYNNASTTVNYLVAQLSRAANGLPTGEHYAFYKSLQDRLDFLLSLKLDIETITKEYVMDYFPKRGSACRQYNSDCYFYGECDLTSARIAPKPDTTKYDYYFELEELITDTVNELREVQHANEDE